MNIKKGNLFAPFAGRKFDIIIANVPQENLSPNIIKSLSRDIVIGMHGGKNGNELLLKALKDAPNLMHRNSRMYVVVYSMSDFRKSLRTITKRYNARMINFFTGPVKDFVYSDIDWYINNSKNGKIEIYKNGKEYFADLLVFELKLK